MDKQTIARLALTSNNSATALFYKRLHLAILTAEAAKRTR